MQSISNALNRLQEDVSWFIRAKEVKLLQVRTSGDLWSTVVRLLPMFEFDRDNGSPWVVLEDAHTTADDGWRARAARLREHWDLRRKIFLDREKIEMPLAKYPSARSSPAFPEVSDALWEFGSALAGVLRAQSAPLDGKIVVVLAPGVLDEAETFGSDLLALTSSPSLKLARWIVVLGEDRAALSIVERLGPDAMICDCAIDPEQQGKDFDALASAPKLGRAGPQRIEPPRRVDAPPKLEPELRDAKLRAAGIDPAYLEQAPVLAKLLFGAALAMKDGRGKDAISIQRQARDLAASLGLHDVQVICTIALASYLSGLDKREDAVVELRSAIEHAEQHQLGLAEAQARLALGLLFALDKRYSDAVREYAQCARGAEHAGSPLIAIEGWRLAGQIGIELGSDSNAALCFREAIRIAEGTEVAVAQASSAAEAARALAKRYADKGFEAHAESLFQQAYAIEQGEVGRPKVADQ
ncbi:hypothetical protein WKW80_33015 [Variovorax humicola]|uniref:MalT-like TPR region domain-containing protein n=1 Tax=Variovorax humicola TaxID=1769758 RepID=A0ABU8WBW6_9BURK